MEDSSRDSINSLRNVKLQLVSHLVFYQNTFYLLMLGKFLLDPQSSGPAPLGGQSSHAVAMFSVNHTVGRHLALRLWRTGKVVFAFFRFYCMQVCGGAFGNTGSSSFHSSSRDRFVLWMCKTRSTEESPKTRNYRLSGLPHS